MKFFCIGNLIERFCFAAMDLKFSEFDSSEWKLMSQVSRPSRYCGSEWRPYKKIPWNEATLKICLAFPDVYETGMSYYGFQIIEGFINSTGKNFLSIGLLDVLSFVSTISEDSAKIVNSLLSLLNLFLLLSYFNTLLKRL